MISPTSRPEVKRIAIKVNSGTGVTPVSGRFHHLIVQKTVRPKAMMTPNEMMVVNILSLRVWGAL